MVLIETGFQMVDPTLETRQKPPKYFLETSWKLIRNSEKSEKNHQKQVKFYGKLTETH